MATGDCGEKFSHRKKQHVLPNIYLFPVRYCKRTVRLFFGYFEMPIHFNLFHVPMEIYRSLIFMSAVS